jgi:tetratricopeptide (TPR) repeat protein
MNKRGFLNNRIIALILLLLLTLTGCGASDELTRQAMDLIQKMEYQSALELLDGAERSGENERLINRARGIAYMGQTDYANAIAAFEAALKGSDGLVQSIDFDLNYYLAAAYTKNEDYLAAEKTYTSILALRNDADAYFLRANVRMKLGNYELAKADFDRTIEMDGANYDRLIEIYEVLDFGGHADVGKSYLQAALNANGSNMDSYVIGRIYFYLGEYQKACLALEDARKKGGLESYLYLARAYEATGDFNYAANVYHNYLAKHEGTGELYNHLGLCELARGENQKALEAFQAGIKIEGNNMLQSLAFNEVVAYERLGDYAKAKELLTKYMQNYPDDEEAKRELAFLEIRSPK